MALKTFKINLGDGDYATFNRLDGYSLYVGGAYRGSFDTFQEAEAYRDELRSR